MTLNSQQYANLADHSYGRDQQGSAVDLNALVGKTTEIEGVRYKVLAHADKPSGYQGTIYQRVDTGEIVVAHRGTEFGREPIKDGLLADGGMVFGRVNSQARDAIELTRHALEKAQDYARHWGTSPPEVSVTGHSLGGTLAQITAHHFDLRGETFNAYGAASLGYQIPEGGDRVLNHVLAADVVSSASPHYGQVRLYAQPGEIAQLQASGYNNIPLVGGLAPNSVVAASINGSHMMHNFLNVNGDGQPDVSTLRDASARTRADENARMIGRYRDDVRELRAGASLLAPARAAERLREAIQPDLPPGEPARREVQGERRTSNDMREPSHPAHGKYRQAYTGVVEIDHTLGRTPDGASERLAASLTAAGAGLSSIGQVALSGDGSRAFAVEGGQGPVEARSRVHVDVAAAVQRPVEASTQEWQEATQRLALQQQEQLAREQAQQPMVRGPAMA
jgi:hypothetical protein